MVRPDYRSFRDFQLQHSAKGSTWNDHKYIKVIDGVYYYPNSYEGGRHLGELDASSLRKPKISKKFVKKGKVMDDGNSQKGTQSISKTSKKSSKEKNVKKGKVMEEELSSEEIDKLANDVIRGKYGDGEKRKKQLGDKYDEVQKRVNEILRGESSSTGSKKVSKNSKKMSNTLKNVIDKVGENKIKKNRSKNKSSSSGPSKPTVKTGVDLSRVLKVYKR